MSILKILECKEDYKFQGPRFIKLGPNSGEEFRETFLIPWLKENESSNKLVVDFEGTSVYTPSFLEEAFGGTVRKGFKIIQKVDFINLPENELLKIKSYIK